MKIKVLLVDDHLVVLRGLDYFLQTKPHIEIVGQAKDGIEALQKVRELNPDVVLMDVKMPKMDGIEATRRIKRAHPHVKVLVLTSFSDQDSVIPALKAGAIGYQLKDVDPDVLVETIEAVMKGNRTLHPQVTHQLISHISSEGNERMDRDVLTPREKEVLHQITMGYSNKEIAVHLHISEKTVKTHITSILKKLELQDRTQAAIFALQNNFFNT